MQPLDVAHGEFAEQLLREVGLNGHEAEYLGRAFRRDVHAQEPGVCWIGGASHQPADLHRLDQVSHLPLVAPYEVGQLLLRAARPFTA